MHQVQTQNRALIPVQVANNVQVIPPLNQPQVEPLQQQQQLQQAAQKLINLPANGDGNGIIQPHQAQPPVSVIGNAVPHAPAAQAQVQAPAHKNQQQPLQINQAPAALQIQPAPVQMFAQQQFAPILLQF